MTEPSAYAQQIAAVIRPAMLTGLQEAELLGPVGTQRINEWADWISEAIAQAVVQPITAERDAFADRVDTLSHIAKRHKDGYADAVADVQKLEIRITELEAELAELRAAAELGRD
ncbi:hypothetical protein [Kitasatospora sp. MAP5-34]|uniref:hypothetical protein n=1 Tax=Kitasatospora sp. MAP5-34 TaxID=3035102 RepID=UPI002475C089|nr:hypothetical protein [Kitasatospora sp. MAP5-34]MDH6576849.1 hypothetical protein [Kitasatospora sp. MAP5-34]